ncbi:MAG TPA: site-specific integrase [Candidatus Acidoferrales bacterium]|nr:site-specific integrase [Candidatus Acidoferrales bacterium]
MAEEHLRPLNQGQKLPLSTITLEGFVERHFIPNVFPTLKPSTQNRYCCTLKNHLLPAFGNQRLCDIGGLDLQRFVLQKMESGLGWESVDHFRNLMSKIFAMARKWSFYCGENPACGVALPEKKAIREKHVLSPDQISQLLALVREPFRTMVLLGILTGMRIGEILGLRWKDVDFASGQIRVEQAVYRGLIGSPKTKGSRRILPLPEFLTTVLADLCRDSTRPQKDLVFQTRKGTPHSDTNLLHRELKPAGRQIGAPWLSWHTLRRTHATLLQAAGGSLKDAQAQLGHSKLSTTLEIYTLPIPAHQRVAVEKLWDLLTNVDDLRENGKGLPERVEQIQ